MTRWDEKVRVAVGNVSVELPASVVQGQDAPVDSAARVFAGGGMRIIVDQGPFANRLDAYAGLPDYQQQNKDFGGTTARTISFRTPERGTSTVAIHVPAPKFVTVVVEADSDVPKQVSEQIINSLRWID